MRVSFFTDSFFPYVSGVSSVVANHANELARRGHSVAIFRPKPKAESRLFGRDEVDASIRLFDLPVTIPVKGIPNLDVVVPMFLSTVLGMRKFRPELVHCHTEFGCGIEGMLLGRLKRIPVMGTFHTFFAEPNYLKQFHIPDLRLTRYLMWKYSVTFFNRCRTIISPSQSVRKYLREWGIAKDPVVLSNGIARPRLKPHAEVQAMRKEWGIEDFCFIYVGRLSPEKSLDLVLDAFGEVHRSFRGTKLILIGVGPSEKHLSDRIVESGLGEAVIQPGRFERKRLLEENLFRLGDVFVTASKTENQPISILEAMAFGLPIVGPKAKGIPELVSHGYNGFLFDPDDLDAMCGWMRTLLLHRNLCREMGENSAKAAMSHSMDKVADQLEALYSAAVQPCGRRPVYNAGE